MKNFKGQILITLILNALGSSARADIPMESVSVGNTGNPNDATTGYGRVDYHYAIGKYEVTLNQYTAFLNAVGTTDTYGLYNPQMFANANVAGISRSGTTGNYTYAVIGNGNRPVTYVSWFDAARFVNWLQNGQATGAQIAGTTETGTYNLLGATSGVGFARSANWTFGLPTENEWYKAAYHQPEAQGGDSDGYWLYPTAHNSIPNAQNGSASDPNSANFFYDDGIANGVNNGYAASQSGDYSWTQQYLTEAGAFAQASSHYGTFDQGGNVWEWNDAIVGASRGIRGGSWLGGPDALAATERFSTNPSYEDRDLGFRIVVVPEPSLPGLFATAALALTWQRQRRR